MEHVFHEAVQKEYLSGVYSQYSSFAVLRKLVGKDKKVLDVGCAGGHLGKLLIEKGNVMYGVDGNVEAVNEAKKYYKEATCLDLNNVTEFPFPYEQFDVIVFADILEHLLYPEEILKTYAQFLKPDGRIIVSLPNVALWRVRLNLLLGNFEYTDYGVLDRTHLHLYTFKTAKKLVRDCGLRVISDRAALNLNLFGFLVTLFPFLKTLLGIHVVIEAKK